MSARVTKIIGGKRVRGKGKRGEALAREILKGRDWKVHDLENGMNNEDFIAICPEGITWSVEVKNCNSITVGHRNQAMAQGKKSGLPWMLVSHICGTSSWLIQRQGKTPVVWSGK